MADLTTLKDVKAFLGNSTKEHDTLLTTLLTAVTSEIEAWLQRSIALATSTDERVSVGVPSHVAVTRFFPIVSIASLLENNVALVLDTDYELNALDKSIGRVIRISGGETIPWVTVPRTIKLTYTHGYTTIPPGVAQAAISLVASDFYASEPSQKARFGIRSRSMGTGEDVAFLTRDEIWKEQQSRLLPYRRL